MTDIYIVFFMSDNKLVFTSGSHCCPYVVYTHYEKFYCKGGGGNIYLVLYNRNGLILYFYNHDEREGMANRSDETPRTLPFLPKTWG